MSKVIQYFHNVPCGYTSVVHVPTKDEFIEIVNNSLIGKNQIINMIVGSSRLHPKDKYIRKEGRELALKKTKQESFKLISCVFIDNIWTIQLKNLDDASINRVIALQMRPNRNTVFFIDSMVKGRIKVGKK